MSGPRIKPCCTLYFNVSALENTLSIQTKNFLFGLKPFHHICPEAKMSHFFKENSMV